MCREKKLWPIFGWTKREKEIEVSNQRTLWLNKKRKGNWSIESKNLVDTRCSSWMFCWLGFGSWTVYWFATVTRSLSAQGQSFRESEKKFIFDFKSVEKTVWVLKIILQVLDNPNLSEDCCATQCVVPKESLGGLWEGQVELLLWSSGVPSPDVHDAVG